MKIERAAWILAVFLLLIALTTTYMRYRSLQLAVLAGESERAFASAALAMFSREQDVAEATVRNDFYVTYIGLGGQVCIGLVPKPSAYGGTIVYGGATTYCFTDRLPIRLLRVHRAQE